MTDLEDEIATLIRQDGIEKVLRAAQEACLVESEDSEPDKATIAWWANIAMGLENTIAVAEDGE